MSMDIRSFFGGSPQNRISNKAVESEKKKKQTKKKMVIISDSESEDEGEKKKKKANKRSPTKSPKSPNKQGQKGSASNTKEKEIMSKYFNMTPVKPTDVFGSAPVKRVPAPKPAKNNSSKKNNMDLSRDDEFDEMLLQLDDDDVDAMVAEAVADEKKNEKRLSAKKDDASLSKEKKKEKKAHTLKEEKVAKRGSEKKVKMNGVKASDSVEGSPRAVDAKGGRKKTAKSESVNLSESDSDSDKDVFTKEKLVKNWKSLVNGDKLMSSVKDHKTSPPAREKEPVSSSPSPVKEISKKDASKKNGGKGVVRAKNLCIDLSESDGDEEEDSEKCQKPASTNLKAKLSSPQKRKVQPNDSPSVKKRKVDDHVEEKTGQKRKFEDESVSKNKKVKNDDPSPSKSRASTSSKRSPVKQEFERPPPLVSNLWVDKYKPSSLKQLIGQQGPKSNVAKLLNWLSKWKSNHTGNKKLQRPSPWAKDDDGAFFKAALLSGPPGIGKTTTAHLVCKELGFDVVEFNASDTRSKKLLHQEVSELLSSKSLAPYFTGGGEDVTRNHALVMDEVDGMAGNEDRGGIQELIQLVKTARVPIVCMCNDRNHPKMRSLVNYCFDLRFSRPRVEQIKGAMMSICFKEGLKVHPDKMNDVIKSTNQDIRLVLNHLSVLAAQKDSKLPDSEKFIKLGPWDVLRKVFSEDELNNMSFHDKSDLFFHDYSIAPLFVHENFLNVVPHAKLNKREKMEAFAKAADSLCTGDLIEKVIRTRNVWSMLPVQAVFSSVIPGETLKGHLGGQISFPAWFGKNSTRSKLDRLQQELLVHTRLKVSGSKEAINLEYSSHLRDLIIRPLVQQGSEGVPASLEALQNYDLLKEDLESLSELCKWPNSKDPMAKVDSKVKAAFTRAYNKSSVLSPYTVSSVVKKGRGGAGPAAAEDELYAEGEEEEGGERALGEEEEAEKEDEDNVEVDAMISIKKKTAKKQQEPSTSKQRGGGGAGGKRGRGRGK